MNTITQVVASINEKVAEAFKIALFDTVEELKRQSYVGATNQLRSGWDYTLPEISENRITATITNDASRVVNRIAGRSNGVMPPVDPIEQWVKRKLKIPAAQAKGVAFAIAKKIAKEGTDRYQSGENFIDLQLDSNLKINSKFEEIFKDKFRSALNDSR